jgi:DNA-binding transcriptional regulator YiaG
MPDLLRAIREEVGRLARKEIRKQLEVVKRASALHRREIARLKRDIVKLEKRADFLESQERKRLSRRQADADVQRVRFSPRSVKAQRRRLGLSAEDFGTLIGVSAQTVYHWERAKSRPRRSQLAALAATRSIGKREARERLSLFQQRGPEASQQPPG